MHEFGSGAKNVHRNASKAGNFLCSEGIAEGEEHLMALVAHAGRGNVTVGRFFCYTVIFASFSQKYLEVSE